MSQELEKCLDCLLLISDSVTALGEEDTLGKFWIFLLCYYVEVLLLLLCCDQMH